MNSNPFKENPTKDSYWGAIHSRATQGTTVPSVATTSGQNCPDGAQGVNPGPKSKQTSSSLIGIWGTYVPLYLNGTYYRSKGTFTRRRLNKRRRSVKKQRWEKRKKGSLTRLEREALEDLLTKMNLPRHVVKHCLYLKYGEVRRIEDFINGIIDTLLLCNPDIFGNLRNEVKDLIRKIISVGVYSREELVTQWKNFTNGTFHDVAETVLIGEPEPVTRNNIFKVLFRIPELDTAIKRIRNSSDPEMEDLVLLGHLVSTRHLPYMGGKVRQKAYDTLVDVTTSPDPFEEFSEQDMFDFKEAARILGQQCRTWTHRKGPGVSEGSAHLSATSSGEISHAIKKGGQGAALRDIIVNDKFGLAAVAEKDHKIQSPFGEVHIKAGVPLWKQLFREGYETASEEFLSDKELLAPWIHGNIPKGVVGYYYGLDGVLGQQLLFLSWLYWSWSTMKMYNPSQRPILKVSEVHEPGNKCRLITLSEWWVNLFQMPFGHITIEMLSRHPAAFSSTQRQDQAWSALDLFLRRKEFFSKEFYILSSDLKNATNALSFRMMKFLFKEFFGGWFGTEKVPPYLSSVLELCFSSRVLTFPKNSPYYGKSVYTTRGVFMGEAIAKPSLILWGLVVEKVAMIRYNRLTLPIDKQLQPWDSFHGKSFREGSPGWRSYHQGGDDHVAVGPKAYLDLVTQTYILSGAQFSPGQHGYTRKVFKYCERVVSAYRVLDGCKLSKDEIIADSVKLRVVTTATSTLQAKDNKNVAIGKASMLSKNLAWGSEKVGWTSSKKRMVLERFIQNMGGMMPSQFMDEKLFAAVHLPKVLGGYGLGLPEDIPLWLSKSPWEYRAVVTLLKIERDRNQANCRGVLKLLSSLNKNPAKRGIVEAAKMEEEIIQAHYENPSIMGALTFEDIRNMYPDVHGGRKLLDRAEEDGIISVEEYASRATRGTTFRELIMNPDSREVFNTKSYKSGFKKLRRDYRKVLPKVLDRVKAFHSRGIKVDLPTIVQGTGSHPDKELRFPKATPMEILALLSHYVVDHDLTEEEQEDPLFVKMMTNDEILALDPKDLQGDKGLESLVSRQVPTYYRNFKEITFFDKSSMVGMGTEDECFDNFVEGPALLPQRESGRPDMNVGLGFLGWHGGQ